MKVMQFFYVALSLAAIVLLSTTMSIAGVKCKTHKMLHACKRSQDYERLVELAYKDKDDMGATIDFNIMIKSGLCVEIPAGQTIIPIGRMNGNVVKTLVVFVDSYGSQYYTGAESIVNASTCQQQ